MIAGIDSKARVDLRAKTSPDSEVRESKPRKFSLRKPGVAKPNTLMGFLSFIVVLLSCTMASLPYTVVLLGSKSLSGLLGVAEPREELFY